MKKSEEEELLEEVLEHDIGKRKLCPLTTTLVGHGDTAKFIADHCCENGCGWFSIKHRCCGIRLMPKAP